MNYIDIATKIMNGEKIYNIPLRVCYYARVSTDSDIQINSLENQRNYYINYIKSNPNWTYIDGYIDEGISGVRVENRESFKRMIHDAKQHKFDLIITKEVSRFARDLEDSIHYIRILKEANVGVYFENQNINTFDINSELILNIMFNLAQEESKKLSSRIKFGHREAIKKGHVLGSSNIIGYKKSKCKLVIDQNEAKLIRIIFQTYATGKYGLYKLAKHLGELGYLNKNGQLYDKDTLKRIIKNPKYKGYYRGHTYEIIDYRTKKRKKIEENNQIIYKCTDGSIPQIIKEELWNKANQILNNRSKSYDNNHHTGSLKYSLSSKIYCKEHNVHFQRSHGNKNKNRPTWSCGNYLKYRLSSCVSPIIPEKDLLNILNNIFEILITNKDLITNEMIDLYNKINRNINYEKELINIEKSIKDIEIKKDKTLELVYKNIIKEEDIKNRFNKFNSIINNLLKNKNTIINTIQQNNYINIVSNTIKDELNNNSLDDYIRKFVSEIIISKINNDRYNLKLDIYLNISDKEKRKIKGANHINGPNINDKLYILNNNYISKKNNYTYSVYFETL